MPPQQLSYAQMKELVQAHLINKTTFLKDKDNLTEDGLRSFVDDAITMVCKEKQLSVSFDDRIRIIRELVSGVLSLGPLRPLIEDPTISEIMVNGHKTIYIQRKGMIEKTNIQFDDNQTLMHTIQKIMSTSQTSRRVDESSPYVDFSMPDGSRVNVIIPPCSPVGPVMTIRKFSRDLSSVDDLIEQRTLNKQMAAFLIAAVKARLNIIFCGSTGSGKTTLLNVFSSHIPSHERIITIEDTAELRLNQEHVVSLQAKSANIEGKGAVPIRDLFINSLRMRPDRIIIGEIRGDEILDLVQSITSGHSGSLGIVHGDSPLECFNRMMTMMMMSGIRLSSEQIRSQLASAIDLIVHVELYMDGVRRVTNVTDLKFDKETKAISLEDIFNFKQERVEDNNKVIGDWAMMRKKPSCYHKFVKRNVALTGFFEEG